MYGFYRIAAAVPKVKVADVKFNTEEILRLYDLAVRRQCAAVVFPELCITGYSCGDLFFQQTLLDSAKFGASELIQKSGQTVLIFGLPLKYKDAIYNVAAVAQNGKLLGLVPKSHLPNYREFYEKRQFTSGERFTDTVITFGADQCKFTSKQIFTDGSFSFGVEICEDLWSVIPPSSLLTLGGAKAIFNLSASNELVTKAQYRANLVAGQSARCICAYAFASCGIGESVSDVLFSGHAMIADNGRMAAQNKRFDRDGSIIYADIDAERLSQLRMTESSFDDSSLEIPEVRIDRVPDSPDLSFGYNPPYPFIPPHVPERDERCQEILSIQSHALASRLEHINLKTMVIGISGGLDSTLALLICYNCCKILGMSPEHIIAVTMPGFGTTDRTYKNALQLCSLLQVTIREIDIKAAALQHFNDIGHREEIIDVTYENTQARERTQILMDIANKELGIVIGTGDLSEIALGWCTYNGDHMSMYGVNSSIPKTLIRFLIRYFADHHSHLTAVLKDIIDTPVSPELLPATAGEISQKTEDIIGPYELHDFFLYHFIKYGATPDKILYLARHAFHAVYSDELIHKTLNTFIRRFFAQQFKRNCMPDGPKAGSISLSPRGDWRMPSEATAKEWLAALQTLD